MQGFKWVLRGDDIFQASTFARHIRYARLLSPQQVGQNHHIGVLKVLHHQFVQTKRRGHACTIRVQTLILRVPPSFHQETSIKETRNRGRGHERGQRRNRPQESQSELRQGVFY